MTTFVGAVLVFVFVVVSVEGGYPVPTPPGGRNAVHGWLILPWDQPLPAPTTPVPAWFVHHTPEYWPNSPHNFQIILGGTLTPLSVAENITVRMDLPYPPEASLIKNEYTFTPPPPFSLNDLLTGRIKQLLGVVYNGSFDTLYEREANAIAVLDIQQMPTAFWLNSSVEIPNLPSLRYYSYPRGHPQTVGLAPFYFSHQIYSVNANPDFDQVVHGLIQTDTCLCKGTGCADIHKVSELMSQPGALWDFEGIENVITDRLKQSSSFLKASLVSVGNDIDLLLCEIRILEEIHCVVGPAFADRC